MAKAETVKRKSQEHTEVGRSIEPNLHEPLKEMRMKLPDACQIFDRRQLRGRESKTPVLLVRKTLATRIGESGLP